MSDNSWYEKGELPPVGTECEVLRASGWNRCEIKAHMKEAGNTCAVYQMYNSWGFDSNHERYRPIKTEREIAIEDLKKTVVYSSESILSLSGTAAKQIATALYDAGYRKNES